MRGVWAWRLAGACLLGAAPAGLGGQLLTPARAPLSALDPPWLEAWSPLRPAADLPRRAVSAPSVVDLQGAVSPPVGLFGTGGLAAALPAEGPPARSTFRIGLGRIDGDFRRPLDPGAMEVLRMEGAGWRPLGSTAFAIGRVEVTRSARDPSSRALGFEPYGSNPLAIIDTTRPAANDLAVRLEGGAGYAFGSWGVGFSLGYVARDGRTVHPVIPRFDRLAVYGASASVARELVPDRLSLGTFGRVRRLSENPRASKPQPVVIGYVLQGYFEPEPMGPDFNLRRVIDREDRGWGLAAAGLGSWGRWALVAELERAREDQSSQLDNNPPLDPWTSNGHRFRGEVWLPLDDVGAGVHVSAGYAALEGYAQRSDLTGVIFRAAEEALDLTTSVRAPALRGSWMWGGSVELRREHRRRRDVLLRDSTAIVGWSYGAGLSVMRRLGDRARLGLSYGLAGTRPNTSLLSGPLPTDPIFQEIVWPELAYYGARSITHELGVALGRESSGGALFEVGIRFARASPEAGGPGAPGRRNGLEVSLGAELR